MGAIVIRTRFDEGTESAEVATSEPLLRRHNFLRHKEGNRNYSAILATLQITSYALGV
jgi:hypothetical protein